MPVNEYRMHEQFKQELEYSVKAAEKVCEWLKQQGKDVWVKPHTVAERYPDRHDHKDSGDLGYRDKDDNEHVIEVKRLSRNFTIDWFFNRHFFIVDSKSSFDTKEQKPLAYIATNPDITCCGIVLVEKTRRYWWPRKLRDKKTSAMRGEPVDSMFYVISPKLVKWRTIEFQ